MSVEQKTVVLNVRTLFSVENYVRVRKEEIHRRTQLITDMSELACIYRAFPNIYREIDISENHFALLEVIKQLVNANYKVQLIMVMSEDHPNGGLAITQYHERLKYFLGDKYLKTLGLITLDSPKTFKDRLSSKDYYIDVDDSLLGESLESTNCEYIDLCNLPKLLLKFNLIEGVTSE